MRLLEFTLFYLGIPVLVWVTKSQDVLLPVLWLGGIFAWTMLRYGRGHQAPAPVAPDLNLRKELGVVLVRFFIVAVLLTIALYYYHREWLFWLPRKSLGLWGLIVVVYPLLSVLPQALVYRALFERRYAMTFSSPRVSLLVGVLIFCLAHIPFQNVWALAFTLPGGFLFLRTYRRTNALWLSTLEHALYGDLLFTVGWGVCLVNSGTQHLFMR
jgi:membrane protease YdiL (CAAX protease family)